MFECINLDLERERLANIHFLVTWDFRPLDCLKSFTLWGKNALFYSINPPKHYLKIAAKTWNEKAHV